MRQQFGFAIGLTLLGAAYPARACITDRPTQPTDVTYADVVVVGTIEDYRVVQDEKARERFRGSMTDAEWAERSKSGFLSDYARFRVSVEDSIKGEAPDPLIVTWDNTTFGEPDTLDPGPYLIALRRSGSPNPPLRGPSATIFPDPDPEAWSLVQSPCAGPLMFELDSPEAREALLAIVEN